jgi:hypothetical protein
MEAEIHDAIEEIHTMFEDKRRTQNLSFLDRYAIVPAAT